MTYRSEARRAAIIGTGLIGGSVGMALRRGGWHVTGTDQDATRAGEALALGAVDAIGRDAEAVVTFVATPVGQVASEARQVLARNPHGVVTDVGGVKAVIMAAVSDRRFVGGHPMAGSELEGVAGADPDLFQGATWVLTPTPETDPAAYAMLHEIVGSLGADVVALDPAQHDAIVATVSHVPHLMAAALMTLASEQATQHATLLRLAAGGFRDMTRISAGHPGIWPDICMGNAEAIVSVLDRLQASLAGLRTAVIDRDRGSLLATLEHARAARLNLPPRSVARGQDLMEFRIPVEDRPGVIAEVTTLCSDLGVNISDLETTHSAEGRGVLVVVVDAAATDRLRAALAARGYKPGTAPIG